MQHSETFVMASGMAPAFLINPIASASSSPLISLRHTSPAVCINPFTRIQSLVVIGTPKKGFSLANCSSVRTPDAINASAFSASFNASAKRSSTTILKVVLTSCMRLMNAFTTSTLVSYFYRKRKDKILII